MLLQFSVFIEPSGKEGFNATITIPEFVHDQEDDDYVFSIDSEGHVTEIRKYFVPVLKNKLKNFQADLIAAHEKEVQHNTN
ncbi:uncharacterized protein PRCAT00002828001 [Priceomyces carsonii]|uniref:uncharacterized protein n=1 Tax=Priceomyces carsonii TaxID=28549 RepID=UPI002EDA5213|nr:unnamed protein product [Priceomyces carsonii]